MARAMLVVLLVVPGGAVVLLCAWFAGQDWQQLQLAYAHFRALAATEAPLRELFVAEAAQNLHRLNLFADGVWGLLGAILAGLGLHGLAVTARRGAPLVDGQ